MLIRLRTDESEDLTPSQLQFVIDQCLLNLKHGDGRKDKIDGLGATKKLATKLDVRKFERVWKEACLAYDASRTDCFQSILIKIDPVEPQNMIFIT